VPEVIADTSVIQYLYQADLLDLLPTLYSRVAVPPAVAHELSEGRARGIHLPDIAALSWIEVKQVREQALLRLAPDLGPGEREVLALAVQTPDSLALIDDALARQHARLLKVAFTGTLGVLLRAKQSGHLMALAPVLDQLERLRFRLGPFTREAILKLAGE
jgi:predicted nucleic acid-binding protein